MTHLLMGLADGKVLLVLEVISLCILFYASAIRCFVINAFEFE